jgi:predicted nucleic acid-binding Zn ribbon protein
MENDFQHIGNLIKDLIRNNGWEDSVIASRIPEIWYELLGEQGRRVTRFRYFEEGKLHIEVLSAPWRAELILRRHDLIAQINERCGRSIVTELIIR